MTFQPNHCSVEVILADPVAPEAESGQMNIHWRAGGPCCSPHPNNMQMINLEATSRGLTDLGECAMETQYFKDECVISCATELFATSKPSLR